MGPATLTLVVSGLVGAGILECDVNVSVLFTDGPKASKFLEGLRISSTVSYVAMSMYDLMDFTVSLFAEIGEDYQVTANPLTLTLPAMSTSNGDTLSVPLEILSDEVVEGVHSFTADVQQSSLVDPWSSTNIYIVDNDSECSC